MDFKECLQNSDKNGTLTTLFNILNIYPASLCNDRMYLYFPTYFFIQSESKIVFPKISHFSLVYLPAPLPQKKGGNTPQRSILYILSSHKMSPLPLFCGQIDGGFSGFGWVGSVPSYPGLFLTEPTPPPLPLPPSKQLERSLGWITA